MDARLETVCKEFNEELSPEVVEVIDAFLADRPEYTVEKLRKDFVFLRDVVEKKGKIDFKDYK